MAAPGRAEMGLLREVLQAALAGDALEGALGPEAATALLFEALERDGTPPSSAAETRAFVAGPVADALRRRVAGPDAERILDRVRELLASPGVAEAKEPAGVTESIDVDVDPASWDEEDPTATRQMAVVRKPVPVVVLGARGAFADRLVACLGEDRVRAVPVEDAAALRKAVFAYSPLIVLVDGVAPAPVDAEALAGVLRGLPDSAMPVLWGAETGWSRAVVPRLESAGVRPVTLDRGEGIEPLLDLVLARFRGA